MSLVVLLLAALSTAGIHAQKGADAPVTFTRDIAPILYRQCASCHRQDGAAPFSLLTYEDARRHGAQIATATASRYMPPWKPDARVRRPRGRTPVDATTRSRPSIAGRREARPKATARSCRPCRAVGAGWQLGEPDLVVPLPEYTLRERWPDVFRNFVVTVPGTATRYVRGFEFRPGSRAVHHANIRIDPTPASRRLDEADAAPGYEGMVLHTADYPDGHFLGWTPGQATPLASKGLAWRLDPGNDLVVQLHLQPTGKPEIRSRRSACISRNEPPGARRRSCGSGGRTSTSRRASRLPHDRYVHRCRSTLRCARIQPHAHYRARRVSAWATIPDGGDGR